MEGYIGEIRTIAYNWAPADWTLCTGDILNVQQYQALFSLISNVFGGNGSTTFAVPDLRGRTPRGVGQGTGLSLVEWSKKYGAESTVLSLGNLPVHSHSATFVSSGGGSATASGSVSLPFNVTPTLTVSGKAPVLAAMSTAAGSTPTPVANGVLAVNGLNKTYGAAGTGTLQLGPDANVTGTATGTVSGSATGTVSLPVTGSTSGGTVTVGNTGSSTAVSLLNPSLGLNFVICLTGMYPMRP